MVQKSRQIFQNSIFGRKNEPFLKVMFNVIAFQTVVDVHGIKKESNVQRILTKNPKTDLKLKWSQQQQQHQQQHQ